MSKKHSTTTASQRNENINMVKKPAPAPQPTETILYDEEDNTIVGRCNSCRRVLRRNDLYVELKKRDRVEFACDRCIDDLFVDARQLRKSGFQVPPTNLKNPQWSMTGRVKI